MRSECPLLLRLTLWLLLAVLLAPATVRAEIGLTWARSYGTASQTEILATATDGAGNVHVAGYFTGDTLTIGGTTLSRIGSMDSFAAKLDANGMALWARNFGGQSTPEISDSRPRADGTAASSKILGIAVDGAGNVHLAGTFGDASLTTPSLSRIGNSDVLAIKLDPNGGIVWARNFGGAGSAPVAYGVAVDASGNVYLGGHFNGASLTTPALTKLGGVYDAFAIKLDSGGTPIWARNYGGSVTVQAYGIAVDASGNVYLAGKLWGGGGADRAVRADPAPSPIGDQDAFVFKIDSGGTTVWMKTFGGHHVGIDANDAAMAADSYAVAEGKSVAVDSAGNVYLAGEFTGFDLTTPDLGRIGDRDVFALKLDSSGAVTWARAFGGCGITAYAGGIVVDAAGTVVVAGRTVHPTAASPDCPAEHDMTAPSLARIGETDAFIVALDSSGATTDSIGFGGAGAHAYGGGLALDGSGSILFGGSFTDGNLTTPALTRVGSQDALLIKASLPQSSYTLSVSVAGSGTVTSAPSGIVCGATCSASFAAGTSVTLTASAGSGVQLSGWSGACAGTGSTATVSMAGARSCTASFAAASAGSGPRPSWFGSGGALTFSYLEATIGDDGMLVAAIPPGNFNAAGLVFAARQSDGTALPSWLRFDAATLSFVGAPPVAAARPQRAAASANGRWLATAPLRTVLRIVVELQVSDRWGGFANAAFPLIVHAGRGQAAVVAVSVTDAGIGADGPAGVSALSEDGQVVAFQVSSTNLVPSDSAPVPEVFRYDAASGRLARFSTGSFMGTIAGPANGWSGSVAVSADGRAIAFASDAPNVGLPWGNGFRQVWVADATLPRASTITPSPAAASTAADGSLADRAADNPALSDDGRWVAFDSDATNLVAGITTIARRVYRKDRASGAVVLVGDGRRPAISADGRHVAYDDGKSVYRRDLASDSAVEIGAGIAAKMSRDGRFVAFQSGTRVLRKDLATGAIDTVSANGTAPAISGDGRFVAFVALGQVWVRDAIAARTALVSTNPSGRTANGVSAAPAISGDGRFVSFASQATDLAAGLGAGQLCLAGNPLRAPLASGWWWNPDMPGTGFALESAGDRVMLGGFFYDAVGSPIWYLGAGMQSATAASAALNLYRGGQTMDGSYRAAGLLGAVGTAEMIPLSLHTARLSGAHAAELRRYEFAPGGLAAGPQPGSPENGWWWNPDEPGTGWYLEIQNATLFLAGFLYGEDGDPRWLMSRGPMSSTRLYAGSLLGYGGGQMLGGSYRAAVQGASLGTVTLAFASPLAGTLTLPTGRQVPLRRFRF